MQQSWIAAPSLPNGVVTFRLGLQGCATVLRQQQLAGWRTQDQQHISSSSTEGRAYKG